MIISLKNNEGFIYAYFEWDIVNHKGTQDFSGEYMYVRDLWVHPTINGKDIIQEFIGMLEMHKDNKTVRYIYWKREKGDTYRVSRTFTRKNCVKNFIKYFRRVKCTV